MSRGTRPTRFASSLRLALSCALPIAAVACANLSLSDSSFSPGANGSPANPLHDVDAAGGSLGSEPTGDAGIAPMPIVGSPLCNYNYALDASHNCAPDDSSQCAVAEDGGADAGDAEARTACHVIGGGHWPTQACTVAGTGGDGDPCQSGADCQASYECVGSPGSCRHYCCGGNASCNATTKGSFCDVQPVASADLDASADAGPAYRVPVCMPTSGGCKLLTDGQCNPGQTCAVVKDDGTTSCVAIGPVQVGQSCETDHCADGLTCLGTLGSRTCYQLCRVDSPSDCPAMQTCTGSAQLFKDPAYGICR